MYGRATQDLRHTAVVNNMLGTPVNHLNYILSAAINGESSYHLSRQLTFQ